MGRFRIVIGMLFATEHGIGGDIQPIFALTVYAAGWQEGGLTFGYEKFINDIEALQTLAELCSAVPQAEGELAWSALADVAPGGHFFATRHTMQRYREAFYRPLVADLANFGAWENAGARTSAERATGIWKTTLENFRLPARGELAAERIAGYIEKHERAGGAPPTGG